MRIVIEVLVLTLVLLMLGLSLLAGGISASEDTLTVTHPFS